MEGGREGGRDVYTSSMVPACVYHVYVMCMSCVLCTHTCASEIACVSGIQCTCTCRIVQLESVILDIDNLHTCTIVDFYSKFLPNDVITVKVCYYTLSYVCGMFVYA